MHIGAARRLTPSPWETSWQSTTVSHWLGTNLESALHGGLCNFCRFTVNIPNKLFLILLLIHIFKSVPQLAQFGPYLTENTIVILIPTLSSVHGRRTCYHGYNLYDHQWRYSWHPHNPLFSVLNIVINALCFNRAFEKLLSKTDDHQWVISQEMLKISTLDFILKIIGERWQPHPPGASELMYFWS